MALCERSAHLTPRAARGALYSCQQGLFLRAYMERERSRHHPSLSRGAPPGSEDTGCHQQTRGRVPRISELPERPRVHVYVWQSSCCYSTASTPLLPVTNS